MPKPIRVVIVDDSAVVRQTLTQILSSDLGIQVLGAHSNPLLAMRALDREWPDVFTLDVEMPGMDGITFLREIMSTRPTPVVICSSLTIKGAATTLDALAAGAVDIVAKPTGGVKAHLLGARSELVTAVRNAAQANMGALQRRRPGDAGSSTSTGSNTGSSAGVSGQAGNAAAGNAAKAVNGTGASQPVSTNVASARLLAARAQAAASAAGARAMHETTDRIVAIGASTGGTVALEKVLAALPRTAPGVVIVQHMPPNFTRAFAERVDKQCQVRVKEATDNERILPGHVYIAQGGMHLQVKRNGAYYYTEVRDGPPVSRHKPSVNVLFNSVARTAGSNATGIIMTGMGDDGASGMLEMHRAGVRTFAQDEASCVVFGMPKEAIRAGGVDRVVSLDEIAKLIGETKHS